MSSGIKESCRVWCVGELGGRGQDGVTMLELMITLAIVAILAALAAPSFSNFVADVRQSSMMGELSSDIHLARSEAIKRNARVLICPLGAGNTCGNGTNWGIGWVVCYDVDEDGLCDATVGNDANPVKVHVALTGPVTLTGPDAPLYFRAVGTASTLASFLLTSTSGGTGVATRVTTVTPAGSVTTIKQ
jgi:type IV fimbrial biogenesis protein FimT